MISWKDTSNHTVRGSFCNLRAASLRPVFAHNIDMLRTFSAFGARTLLIFMAAAFCMGTQISAGSEQIAPEQARSVALMVARPDGINVDDPDILVDSMDGNGAFVPGYVSFIFIAVDPHVPGKDRTLAMYAVSPRTGDIWELNLCKHYDFPELVRVQHAIQRKTGAHLSDETASAKSMGCEKPPESVTN
jgi:hypothetical protein